MVELPGKNLQRQRCFNHAEREATARCPVCKRDFCRECITEHNHRMLCRSCLASAPARPSHTGSRNNVLLLLLFLLVQFAIFVAFYYIGEKLTQGKIFAPSRILLSNGVSDKNSNG